MLEAIYNKIVVFNYLKVFQCDNVSEFKSEVTTLFEKHKVDIRRATSEYKYTRTTFVEGKTVVWYRWYDWYETKGFN